MTSTIQLAMDSSESICEPTRTAVRRFGQAAIEQQMKWLKDAALQCLEEHGWIVLQKNPSKPVGHQAPIPKATCASPFCPAFDRPFKADEYRISIEPLPNLISKYIPNQPLADMATTCASPINGEANMRGKGESGCLWMHVPCAEHLDIGQVEYRDRIRIEPRLPAIAGCDYRLEAPEKYAVLKWIAVGNGDRGLAGLEGSDFWCKDDGLAVYSSRQQFDYIAWWNGVRVEVAAKEVRKRPLSAVLAYTGVLKERASRLMANGDGMASFHKVIEQRTERMLGRREEVWTPEEGNGTLHKIDEEDKGYEADLDELGRPTDECAAPRHSHSTAKQIRKKAMRWHLSRANRNGWDDYLIGQRNAALRATEAQTDSASESSPDGSISSEAEGSSSESLHLETPMVRFLMSDPEPTPSRSLDPSTQEVPVETDDSFSEEDESLDSWSDPDKTLATICENPGLALRLF